MNFKFYEMFCSVERTFFAVFHIDVNAAKEDMKLRNIMTPTHMRPYKAMEFIQVSVVS